MSQISLNNDSGSDLYLVSSLSSLHGLRKCELGNINLSGPVCGHQHTKVSNGCTFNILYQQTALPPPVQNVVLQVGLFVNDSLSMVTEANYCLLLYQYLLKLRNFRHPPRSG